MVKIRYTSEMTAKELRERFEAMPPASLVNATPERLKALVKDEESMRKIAMINPQAVAQLASQGDSVASAAMNAVRDF